MKPLEEMSVTELEEVKANADRLAAEKREEEKRKLQDDIMQMIEVSPFAPAEILKGLGGKQRRTIPPKYRNPENEAETWTGRGRKPQWVTDYIEQGGDINNCLIVKPNEADEPAEGAEEPPTQAEDEKPVKGADGEQ